MIECPERVEDFAALRHFVAATLAGLENLRADQFELSQQTLYRSGEPCGVYFRLQGPRALSLSAIWEAEQNTVFFYGSCGRRMRRAQLVSRLRIDS
ncbi:MAG TPA: hypothetical protein VF175_02525 [Lacipirellula sp.]